MFVVFEGIDGSGKTTISNRVASALRTRGVRVEHVREGGRFASGVTQGIREFCRDARNLALSPRAELLMYTARDVQLIDEAVRGALARADLVLADRFLYSAEILARHGRGLPDTLVRGVIDGAADGLQPDLVILVDVDPTVARGRRKVAKILTPDPRPSSRKGLGGSGLQHRFRQGYLEMAANDPGRWVVVDNSDEDLEAVVALALGVIEAGLQGGPAAAVERARAARAGRASTRPPVTAAPSTPAQALASFLSWVDRRSEREPDLAAYVLSGLYGPGLDERRLSLSTRTPRVIARGLKGLCDPTSWQLRRTLVRQAPGEIATSLHELAADTDEAWELRAAAEGAAPAEVALSLSGLDGERAWELRDRLYPVVPDAVMGSLALVASPRANELRERWLAERGGLEAALAVYDSARLACRSISSADDELAWRIRKTARDAAPVPAILSLRGAASAKSWQWRERYLERAPRPVLSTVAGLDDMRAWAMRQATATRCREALDSMIGLDHPIGWEIREACLDIWPSTVVKSLGVLVSGARGYEILVRELARYPENISLLKHAAAVASGAHLTPQVMAA